MKIEIKIEVDAAEAAKLMLILKTVDNAKIVEWITEMMPRPKESEVR